MQDWLVTCQTYKTNYGLFSCGNIKIHSIEWQSRMVPLGLASNYTRSGHSLRAMKCLRCFQSRGGLQSALPEQVISVERTDEFVRPIRGPELNQSQQWKPPERWLRDSTEVIRNTNIFMPWPRFILEIADRSMFKNPERIRYIQVLCNYHWRRS